MWLFERSILTFIYPRVISSLGKGKEPLLPRCGIHSADFVKRTGKGHVCIGKGESHVCGGARHWRVKITRAANTEKGKAEKRDDCCLQYLKGFLWKIECPCSEWKLRTWMSDSINRKEVPHSWVFINVKDSNRWCSIFTLSGMLSGIPVRRGMWSWLFQF